MARVAFFTETLPPDTDPISDFSFELMRGLAEQQHELRIFSTYRPERDVPRFPARIEVMFPFRRWSWLEVPRVLPLLLHFQPEIMHIIQPRRESLTGFTNAMNAIANLPSVLGKPALVTSFYDLRESDWTKHRQLLALSSAITVSTPPQLELMNEWVKRLNHEPEVALVPIPSAASETGRGGFSDADDLVIAEAAAALPEAVVSFLSRHEKIIVVPGMVSSHEHLEEVFDLLAETLVRTKDTSVIFAGDWGDVSGPQRRKLARKFDDRGIGSRFFITGSLPTEVEATLLKKASVVFLAALPVESLHLARIERQALQVSSALILNTHQVASDSLSWRDRDTAFVAGPTPSEWGASLHVALTDEPLTRAIRMRLPEFARRETIDLPGNVMSRIYAGLLERKTRRTRS